MGLRHEHAPRAETIAAFKRRIEGENSGPRKCWNCGDYKVRAGGEYQPGSRPGRCGGWFCADCIRRAAERKSKEVTQ